VRASCGARRIFWFCTGPASSTAHRSRQPIRREFQHQPALKIGRSGRSLGPRTQTFGRVHSRSSHTAVFKPRVLCNFKQPGVPHIGWFQRVQNSRQCAFVEMSTSQRAADHLSDANDPRRISPLRFVVARCFAVLPLAGPSLLLRVFSARCGLAARGSCLAIVSSPLRVLRALPARNDFQ